MSDESFEGLAFGGGGRFGESPFGQQAGYRQSQQTRQQPGNGRMKGQNLNAKLEITLEEAFKGVTKTLRIREDKVKVKIPKGIKDGQKLKLKGKGGESPSGNSQRGDLYLKILIRPHHQFERKGDDLYLDQPIDLYTAILGGKVSIPTLNGSLNLTIPEETQNGKRFKLSGQGMPHFGKSDKRGDLYVTADIQIPTELTEQEKEKFEALKALRSS